MKRLLLLMAAGLVLVACLPADVDHISWDNYEIEWDPDPELVVVEGDTVTFRLYRYTGTVADDQNPALLVFVAEVSELTHIVDLAGLGRSVWYIGIEQVVTDSEGVEHTNGIAWTNDPEDVATETFALGVNGPVIMGKVRNLRLGG